MSRDCLSHSDWQSRLTNRKSAHHPNMRLAKAVNSSQLKFRSVGEKLKKIGWKNSVTRTGTRKKGHTFFAIRESHSKMTEVNIPPIFQYQVALC